MSKLINFWKEFGIDIHKGFYHMLNPDIPVKIKVIPFLGLLYVISPVDIIPDFLIGPGFLDDIGIMIISIKMFTSLVNTELKSIKVEKEINSETHVEENNEDNEKIEEGEIIQE